ncbi:MAG: hypothetical protein ACF8R9_07105 [Phycisphaerales bacterium JB054]
MKHDEVEALRREVGKHQKGRGKRYPVELKAQLVAYATQRRAAGAAFATISEELGLGHETVRRWCTKTECGSALSSAPTKFVPVEVVAEERSSLAIVSPSGFRLEGLDMTEAVAALRALR